LASSETYIQNKLDERKLLGTYRALRPESNLIDFCSNDYLGFARSPFLKSYPKRNRSHPLSLNGATGSRLISGNITYAEELEQQIATFHQARQDYYLIRVMMLM
jgi:8-amino-7-oxononanoate synthase